VPQIGLGDVVEFIQDYGHKNNIKVALSLFLIMSVVLILNVWRDTLELSRFHSGQISV
jgi:uncharacterized membrane protein (Fun14 family)